MSGSNPLTEIFEEAKDIGRDIKGIASLDSAEGILKAGTNAFTLGAVDSSEFRRASGRTAKESAAKRTRSAQADQLSKLSKFERARDAREAQTGEEGEALGRRDSARRRQRRRSGASSKGRSSTILSDGEQGSESSTSSGRKTLLGV